MSEQSQRVPSFLNPHDISKANDPEGRSKTAAEISANAAKRAAIDSKKKENEQKHGETLSAYELKMQEISNASSELAKRLDKLVVKAKAMVGLGDRQEARLRTTLQQLDDERSSLEVQLIALNQEIESLNQQGAGLPSARELLNRYYEEQIKTPLTNSEKRELLTPEVMQGLSTDEYIKLWRRLNPNFLTHVTRQGFRDHVAMQWHVKGQQEFHDGFTGCLEDDKKLRPPLALKGLARRDKESVKAYLEDYILEADTAEEARRRFAIDLDNTLAAAPSYPDRSAVHFAAEVVADEFYGGETGNEVFFIFPSDFLASQHDFAFNGNEKTFIKPQSEMMWNDVFVWPNDVEDANISLDAGMVFLPENTMVDPVTGSKYATRTEQDDGHGQRSMVEDTELMQKFVDWFKNLKDSDGVMEIITEYVEEKNYYRYTGMRDWTRSALAETITGLGFRFEASIAIAGALLNQMKFGTQYGKTIDEPQLLEMLRESGASWKRAENAIPSKEYWEKRFTANPGHRPKHVIYYAGSPTMAVYKFLAANGIHQHKENDFEGELLGFGDRMVEFKPNIGLTMDPDQDPRALRGYAELKATANEIITEHYEGKS